MLPNGEAANALFSAEEGGTPSEPDRCRLPVPEPAVAAELTLRAEVDEVIPETGGDPRGIREGWVMEDGIPAEDDAACRIPGRWGVVNREGLDVEVGREGTGGSSAGTAKGGSSLDGIVLHISEDSSMGDTSLSNPSPH